MTWSYLLGAALLAQAFAIPKGYREVHEPEVFHRDKRQEAQSGSPPDFAILSPPTATPYGPAGASGSLRGPASLAGYNPASPIDTSLSATVPQDQYNLAPGQDEDADLGLYLDLASIENPQPIRGGTDAPTDPGPRNRELEKQNPDLYAPPGTDSGDVPNAKWPLALSHNRHGLKGAGWARQQNVANLPIATAMAGVDMHLEPNAYRELHWHQADEWSLILNGSARISAVNEAGETFVDDVQAGDVWFFPAGVPHSIQAFDSGVEFLLVFDSGDFSEDGTFLVSELFERNPKSVLAKDLRVDTSAFDNLPEGQLYILPGTPAPKNISEQNITGPAGSIPMDRSYSYHFSQQEPYKVPGGSVKLLDSTTFPIAKDFAVALFTIKPGAMRELHWHTTSDEWDYFISGQGRLTVYAAPQSSRTFDFQAGDTGYVPVTAAHYLENTGTEDLVYLEVLQAPVYNDISVAQWLGLTPKQVVKDHLGFSDDTLSRLPKIKPFILPGDKNLTQTNFTSEAE
ncbi:Putative rmlC-like cupin domain superfamily, rmlC-like jelly roll protein [Septoria linicola]|uniref:RmlC-like cupin domain superfamily, rmlC-like jelly roll protein n=1 Tax=Septoria linicola TaxID=215465 RepID=A0A9Q9ARK1_9PEZI|nr:Putative rmlC-like cupin domain superfamily, rmlC-like jelly roll protein [Septoria linicola]